MGAEERVNVRPTVLPPNRPPSTLAPRLLAALALLFVFLVGVNGLGDGFRLLGQDFIQSFFAATSNPFIGLIVGLLATTVVQSSSVTTAMVVGLVAAPENPLPLANAIPMIMGANIGTTVTATIVSLAHAGRRDEFERAFPIAICHDVFNYLAVLILLPLEILTGFLGRTASLLAGSLGGMGGVDYESPLSRALDAGFAPVAAAAAALFRAEGAQGVFLILASGAFIFFRAVPARARPALRRPLAGRGEYQRCVRASAVVACCLGAVVTATCSRLRSPRPCSCAGRRRAAAPRAGVSRGDRRQHRTTVTALLAALAVSGPNASAGLEIALVHLLFNVSGLLLIYPLERVRRIPLALARGVTVYALRSRKLTVLGIVLAFYGLPALCILIGRLFS